MLEYFNEFRVYFDIYEAYPHPGITGQNWPLSREIPGYNFIFNKSNAIKKIQILSLYHFFFQQIPIYVIKTFEVNEKL